jgi:hypothetical protein
VVGVQKEVKPQEDQVEVELTQPQAQEHGDPGAGEAGRTLPGALGEGGPATSSFQGEYINSLASSPGHGPFLPQPQETPGQNRDPALDVGPRSKLQTTLARKLGE